MRYIQLKIGNYYYILIIEYYLSLQDKTYKMKLFLITLFLLALGVAGIAIKIWAKKDGKFAGTCASQNPHLNKNGEACGYCGKTADECENR